VVLRQPRARKQPEQRVECRVLKRHHRDGLALEVGRFLDAGILAYDQLHETFAAEHRDDLHRHAVAADHDRPVRDDAPERRVAGAHLLGHVDAAAPNREAHVEAGGGEIALALGKLDRPEGRQNRRRREEIRDLFRGLRRRRRAQQSPTERAAASEEPAAGYFRITCGHLIVSSWRILADSPPMSAVCLPLYAMVSFCNTTARARRGYGGRVSGNVGRGTARIPQRDDALRRRVPKKPYGGPAGGRCPPPLAGGLPPS